MGRGTSLQEYGRVETGHLAECTDVKGKPARAINWVGQKQDLEASVASIGIYREESIQMQGSPRSQQKSNSGGSASA